jgi:3-oxoadipate enol-lactonase
LVGHSLGGYIGFAFAQLFPGRLTGLGLVATQAVADTPEQREGRYATAEKVMANGPIVAAEIMPPIVTSDPALQGRLRDLILETTPQGIAGTLRGMAERPDYSPFLPEIRVPVEIVAGANDRGIPLERSRDMERLIPSAHLTVVPGAGHMVMLERPQETAGAINRLLARTAD